MVMADGTARCQSHPYQRSCFGSIPRVEDTILFVDDSTFVGGDIAAMESRCDSLVHCGVGKKVPRQLFDRELIKR
jgi:hypothetical protein